MQPSLSDDVIEWKNGRKFHFKNFNMEDNKIFGKNICPWMISAKAQLLRLEKQLQQNSVKIGLHTFLFVRT